MKTVFTAKFPRSLRVCLSLALCLLFSGLSAAPVSLAAGLKVSDKTSSSSITSAHYTPVSLNIQELNMVNYIAEDRARNGRKALILDPELCRLARMKSQDMFDYRYTAHTSPRLGNAREMAKNQGYKFQALGENIAKHANVLKAQAAFMSSAGHRSTLLSTAYTHVGVGIVTDKHGFVTVTQLFARK